MSYSSFSFSNLKTNVLGAGDSLGVDVSFDVKNTGRREAAEVAELYVRDPSAQVERPTEELKAFEKVRLMPDETRHLKLHLDRRSFAYWDVKMQNWRVDPGQFTIMVGDSSENLPLVANISLP